METTQPRTLHDVAHYVSGLALQHPNEPFPTDRSPVEEDLVKEGEEQSFLSDKSIVSFVSGVNEQSRKDVLNSTLLAQLAANKQSPIENDITAWYQAYVAVLRNIGWVIQNVEINNYEAKHSLFEVEDIIIDILSAAFGANYIALIKRTLDSLKLLSKAGDGKIRAFEKNTQTMKKGCFQIGVVTEQNGAIAMQLGTFLLTSENQINRILFVKFDHDNIRLDYASGQATLNTELYSEAAREAILAKLKKDTVDYIAAIDI